MLRHAVFSLPEDLPILKWVVEVQTFSAVGIVGGSEIL
jgi:hypothetical protein